MEEFKKWFLKAKEDLNWAKQSYDSHVYYGACFASQQATEKALKSYLLKNKLPLRKIHDLVALLEDCISIDSSFEELRNFAQMLFFYYVETRYPDLGDSENLNEVQAREACDAAKHVIDFVERKIG